RKRATWKATVRRRTRSITSNNLPVAHRTGAFPVRRTDPAYRYTHNGAHIRRKAIELKLPRYPRLAEYPTCLGTGPVGITHDEARLPLRADRRVPVHAGLLPRQAARGRRGPVRDRRRRRGRGLTGVASGP